VHGLLLFPTEEQEKGEKVMLTMDPVSFERGAGGGGGGAPTGIQATGGFVASGRSGVWGSTTLTSRPEECSSSTEREARSVALEKAYVHDVYQQIACHFSDSRYRAWPRVKQFLLDLEPGSFVCDVGKQGVK